MVTHQKRPLNWDPGVGTQHGALQSGDTELTWGRGGGNLHFKPQPTSYPGAAASQGALPDPRPWPPLGPHANPGPWELSLTFRAGELSEGGQRDDGVGDGVYWVQYAGDIVGAAGLDAADSVRLLLAEPEGRQNTRAGEKVGTSTPTETGV